MTDIYTGSRYYASASAMPNHPPHGQPVSPSDAITPALKTFALSGPPLHKYPI